ncbi:MAG: SDR family NAD(P)-dependent oxidoreductase [Janthinobacterium lividum]
MSTERIALVTGADQGVGLEVATQLAATGVTVYVGSRDLARGEAVAAEIGEGATALQIDVTDLVPIAAAAERLEEHMATQEPVEPGR